ncbi:uncharacterized protein CTRU02_203420 [Colletotrichum truncatum]|uniref:Uncharacterized protein n=1 Tax=Colletotrichum truncatum TaxID=5467 RepID=A0ACC3Z9B0_COLTU|nr:uncharacterized protein CTRU02_05802 [Colletotrichum truncatum]KAF6793547.1 hypothetical protein CTRU02_05802 [Colletotrichum truncatum]
MASPLPVESPNTPAAPAEDPSVDTSRPQTNQDPAPGSNDTAHLPDQAPLKATIRPPAAATTNPETGALHHPHHQPTPHATATAATPGPAAATPATVATATAPVPGASLARPNIIDQPPSLDSSLPPMPLTSPSPSSATAPEANSLSNPQPQNTTATSPSTSKMLFSDIYKSPRSPLSKFRHPNSQHPLTLDLPDYDPDLLSKDKVKQKEAVKKHLASKVRNDWEFVWPPVASPPTQNSDPTPTIIPALTTTDAPVQETPEQPQEHADPKPEATDTTIQEDEVAAETALSDDEDEEEGLSDTDAESVYSTVSEDPARFKPRLEWVSDLSDEDPPLSLSPFRFDSPDAIGAAVNASVAEKRAQRRRALREEMQWNEGLACFEARRNAWTGARTVRLRAKPVSPTQTFSPLSPRRLFFRSSISQPPPAPLVSASPSSPPRSLQQQPSNDASAVVSDGSELTKDASKELTAQKSKESARSTTSPLSMAYPIETLIPVPAPLLPPANPMRASITPSVYISLYEKVIVHALTPSCPVNLSDMIKACVVGWKRDGEWPPKPSTADPGIVAVRRRKKSQTEGGGQNNTRRMSFGFLGRGEKVDGQDEAGAGKGIRKSLQRVLGLGHHHPPTTTNASNNGNGAVTGKETTAA